MWEYDEATGRWSKDGQVSPSGPPVGAPFWTKTKSGTWEFETFTAETDPSKPYGNDDQARDPDIKPRVTVGGLGGDNSTGAPNPTPPTPTAPPTNPNLPLVDGRLSRARIAAGGAPPPGVSASAWADIQAGTYSPPRNSGSPGGPTDQFGTLLNAPDPGEAPAYPLFERNKFDQNFKAVDGNSFDGPNNNNYSTQLLASIQEMIDRKRPTASGPASDADMRESNRAQFIMNALSSGRDMNDPFSPQLSSSNAIDNAGEMFDRQEAIQKSKAQRKAWETGDTENMNPRLSAPKNAPKGWEPTDEEPTYVPDPEDDKSKKGRTMYTRRFAMGTRRAPQPTRSNKTAPAPMIGPPQRGPDLPVPPARGGGFRLDPMEWEGQGPGVSPEEIARRKMAGRYGGATVSPGGMPVISVAQPWNPGLGRDKPTPVYSGRYGGRVPPPFRGGGPYAGSQLPQIGQGPPPRGEEFPTPYQVPGNTTGQEYARNALPPIPPSRPAYARRYSYGTGGAGSPPATFR